MQSRQISADKPEERARPEHGDRISPRPLPASMEYAHKNRQRSGIVAVALPKSLPTSIKHRATVARFFAQLAFNGEQTVVFRDAFGTAKRAGFDLARARANGEIGDE